MHYDFDSFRILRLKACELSRYITVDPGGKDFGISAVSVRVPGVNEIKKGIVTPYRAKHADARPPGRWWHGNHE